MLAGSRESQKSVGPAPTFTRRSNLIKEIVPFLFFSLSLFSVFFLYVAFTPIFTFVVVFPTSVFTFLTLSYFLLTLFFSFIFLLLTFPCFSVFLLFFSLPLIIFPRFSFYFFRCSQSSQFSFSVPSVLSLPFPFIHFFSMYFLSQAPV